MPKETIRNPSEVIHEFVEKMYRSEPFQDVEFTENQKIQFENEILRLGLDLRSIFKEVYTSK